MGLGVGLVLYQFNCCVGVSSLKLLIHISRALNQKRLVATSAIWRVLCLLVFCKSISKFGIFVARLLRTFMVESVYLMIIIKGLYEPNDE